MIQTSKNGIISYRVYIYIIFVKYLSLKVQQNLPFHKITLHNHVSLLCSKEVYLLYFRYTNVQAYIVLYLLHAAVRVKVTEPGPHLEATDQQKLMVAGSPKKCSYFYVANGETLNFWRLVGKLKFKYIILFHGRVSFCHLISLYLYRIHIFIIVNAPRRSMDWQIKAAFPSQSFWKNTPNLRSIASMSQSCIYTPTNSYGLKF